MESSAEEPSLGMLKNASRSRSIASMRREASESSSSMLTVASAFTPSAFFGRNAPSSARITLESVNRQNRKRPLTPEFQIRYTAAVSFFPHRDEEDFAVSYDAYFEKTLYEGKGRRSKKKEQAFLEGFKETIDGITKESGGKVLWDLPLREARRA